MDPFERFFRELMEENDQEIEQMEENMREIREEINDLDRMIPLAILSSMDVLTDLNTPAHSDSEDDEVRQLSYSVLVSRHC